MKFTYPQLAPAAAAAHFMDHAVVHGEDEDLESRIEQFEELAIDLEALMGEFPLGIRYKTHPGDLLVDALAASDLPDVISEAFLATAY